VNVNAITTLGISKLSQYSVSVWLEPEGYNDCCAMRVGARACARIASAYTSYSY